MEAQDIAEYLDVKTSQCAGDAEHEKSSLKAHHLHSGRHALDLENNFMIQNKMAHRGTLSVEEAWWDLSN